MLLFFSIILVNQKKSFVDQILKSIRIPMRQSSRGWSGFKIIKAKA